MLTAPDITFADLGGTRTRVGKGRDTINGRVEEFSTNSPDKTVLEIARRAHELTPRKPDIVSVAIAGAVEGNGLKDAGRLKELGWVGYDVITSISEAFEISSDRVVLLNDAQAGGYAERQVRDRSRYPNGAFMTLSTGFGGSYYDENEAYADEPGHHELRKGAICGCGKDGCIEAFASGSGVERRFNQRGEDIPADSLLWNAVALDFTRGLVKTLERYRSTGINPKILGFTGSVALHAQGGKLLENTQKQLFYRLGEANTPEITTAHFGEESGLIGAYYTGRLAAKNY